MHSGVVRLHLGLSMSAVFAALVSAGCSFIVHERAFSAREDAAVDAGRDAGGPDVVVPTVDFGISVSPVRVSLLPGTSASVTVTLARQNFDGAVDVSVTGLPAEVTVAPLTIAAGSDVGMLDFSASASAVHGVTALRVVGSGAALVHDAGLDLVVRGQPGELDQSFGVAGVTSPGLAGGVRDMLVQPDGRVVVVGSRTNNVLAARFLEDGSPDLDFGTGGVFLHDLGAFVVIGEAGLQSDGKIVIAGTVGTLGFLIRLTPEGTLDPDFTNAGSVSLDLGPPLATPRNTAISGLALQRDGRIVVVGSTNTSSTATFDGSPVIARFSSDGMPDASFGTYPQLTGITIPSTLGSADKNNDRFFDVVEQADGRLVAAGAHRDPADNITMAGFARFLSNGQVDPEFSGGLFTLDLGEANGNDFNTGANAIALGDATLLFAGEASRAGVTDACLLRLNPNGTLDTNFGVGGVRVDNIVTTSDRVERRDLALQQDGMAVLVGQPLNGAGYAYDPFVARFDTAGARDDSFGTAGVVRVQLTTEDIYTDSLMAVAILPDGRILAAGHYTTNLGTTFLRVVRIWN